MHRLLSGLLALALAIGLAAIFSSPAEATVRSYCNRNNIAKSSVFTDTHFVPAATQGRFKFPTTYQHCRIPGRSTTYVRVRNTGLCLTITGEVASGSLDAVSVDYLGWNNQRVMNEVNNIRLELPLITRRNHTYCEAKWMKSRKWYRRDSLPRWRVNYWLRTLPPWPDFHHESSVIFLDPNRDDTITVSRTALQRELVPTP